MSYTLRLSWCVNHVTFGDSQCDMALLLRTVGKPYLQIESELIQCQDGNHPVGTKPQ